VAQAETPLPRNRCSDSKPSHKALAPVAMMTDFAKNNFEARISKFETISNLKFFKSKT